MSRSADTPFASSSHRLTTNVVWQYKCIPIVEWVRAVASKQDLSLFQVSGEPYDIGYRLGEIARPVFTEYMEQSSAWQAVRRWHAISSHANHLIHPGCEAEAQIVTDSSHDRQTRVEHLLPRLASPITPAALLDVLQDRAPAGLPIYRDDPLDPDDENTLATALFEIGSADVSMKVYRQGQCAFDTVIPCVPPRV
ncbi:carcinine hydrolase/isopenicillin-N N-acyltransferase family protein [Paraburkholderia aspalathi]|uniref:Acyl-coenzyme A:6-aminopenicillanic acid acyl-transferase n=1 Tax=Paraburkholderia aspalathi TaxID=1324617 RepID=A0A1I7DRG7_9BURK|nr:Acyl-coenzyme A:6-aminopenicillanic acid acyl-transferase [Paraburkholderia aspalathi]